MSKNSHITNIGGSLAVSNDIDNLYKKLESRVGIKFKSIIDNLSASANQIDAAFPAFQTVMYIPAEHPDRQDMVLHYVAQEDVEGQFSKGYADMREYAKKVVPELFNDERLDHLFSKPAWELDLHDRVDRLAIEQHYISRVLLDQTTSVVVPCFSMQKAGTASKLDIIKQARAAHERATLYLGAMEYFEERLRTELTKAGEYNPETGEIPEEIKLAQDLRAKAENIVKALEPALDKRAIIGKSGGATTGSPVR